MGPIVAFCIGNTSRDLFANDKAGTTYAHTYVYNQIAFIYPSIAEAFVLEVVDQDA